MKKVYKHAILKKYLYTLIAEEESEVSVADHYKGTPPLKSKKNKRFSRDIPSDFQVFIPLSNCSQHAEWDLDKIEKTFNGTFTE